MTSAPSLYRRHRPRRFADVVGQQHVVRTLRNALAQGKIHHAYLFVGSRGTGKTSLAKILAAALNCQQSSEPSDPCGVCDSCRVIGSGTSLDVIEMDAASNNSVDDIRDLRERVAFAPATGRYKVYILDEAHMLSTAAWNAFLKTLEEPPPNTVFILATTEANKVLPTVVDRCHRFDFSRPAVTEIAAVIRRATEAESIELPDEACALVARSATGSFRDALGTVEQLVAYAGNKVALEDVLAVLGVAETDLLFESFEAISLGNSKAALEVVDRLITSGRDVERFFTDLEGHARGLMIVGILGRVPAELRITAEIDERLLAQAQTISSAVLARVLDLIATAYRAMKDGANTRTQLELVFLKATNPDCDPSAQALLMRIERIEQRLEAGNTRNSVSSSTSVESQSSGIETMKPNARFVRDSGGFASTGSTEILSELASSSNNSVLQVDAAANVDIALLNKTGTINETPPISNTGAVAKTTPEQQIMDRVPAATQTVEVTHGAVATQVPSETAVTTLTQASQQTNGQHSTAVVAQAPQTNDQHSTAALTQTPQQTNDQHTPATQSPSQAIDFAHFNKIWKGICEQVQASSPLLAAVLNDCRPQSLTDNIVVLAWPESASFLKRKAEDPANKQLISDAISSLLGERLIIQYGLIPDAEITQKQPLTEDELISRFITDFDAQEIPLESQENSV